MSAIAELSAEIHAKYQRANEIEGKYGDGLITNEDDEREVKSLFAEVGDLITKRDKLQETEQRRKQIADGLHQFGAPADPMRHPVLADDGADPLAHKSLGQIFIEDGAYQTALKNGAFNSPANVIQFAVEAGNTSAVQRIMQQKALSFSGTASSPGLILPDYRPGVLDLLQRPMTLLDIIPTTPTTSDTINFVKESSRTNNAAMVAEATVSTGATGTKPESGFVLTPTNVPVRTAATYIPVTNKMLADAPAIRGLINQRLMSMLELTIEGEILTGDGTGEHYSGILGAGISTIGVGTDYPQDAIYKAAVAVAVTGEVQPDTIVMNPLNWQTLRLARESASTATPGGYLMGPPSMVGADTLWGYRVIISQAMTANTALVGSFRFGGMYFEREGAVIRTGLINDQFIRNMQTVLVEARGAWATFRPTAYCRVTGLT